ncbi:hypothetical protein [Streptomyces sp. NPDC047070]|uniref:hypothetical protein n=1 Tax=Streptomyces sp. NPDC047070 TaxID=3154923 RepID=UPI00345305DE
MLIRAAPFGRTRLEHLAALGSLSCSSAAPASSGAAVLGLSEVGGEAGAFPIELIRHLAWVAEVLPGGGEQGESPAMGIVQSDDRESWQKIGEEGSVPVVERNVPDTEERFSSMAVQGCWDSSRNRAVTPKSSPVLGSHPP